MRCHPYRFATFVIDENNVRIYGDTAVAITTTSVRLKGYSPPTA